jgi:hypothetical protein
VYSFSHLTLQEYLTAQYIADNNLIEQLVTDHLSDERWREVFLLVAGLVRAKNGADDLLLLMEKEAQKYINTPKLQELLQWADAATKDSEGDFKPVGKRAAAIAIARTNPYAYARPNANANANAIANAIANANLIDNLIDNAYAIGYDIGFVIACAYAIAKVNGIAIANANVFASLRPKTKANAITNAIAIAEEFKKIKIFKDVNWTELIAQLTALKERFPDANQSDQIDLAFSDCLLDSWCNALHLNIEIVKLSKEETRALRKYLYANDLIIKCKEAAVRISAKTWEEIESRMLLVPENSTL